MSWTVHLNNGEEIVQDENNLSHWRTLVARCNAENLTISKMFYNDIQIDEKQKADAHFVIYDVFVPSVLYGGKDQYMKLGIGSMYRNRNKCRINWFPLQKYDTNKLIPDQLINKDVDIYEEFCIERTMNDKINK